jgi:hypothetical protein
MLPECLADFIALVILVGALVLGKQIAVPFVIAQDGEDLFVGDGGLLEIVVHVDELGMAAVDVGQQGDDVLRLVGNKVRVDMLTLGKFGAES